MRTKITMAAMACAGLTALTACGGGPSKETSTHTPSDSPSQAAVTSATPSPTATAAPAVAVLPKRALENALLTIDDLPPGYSQDSPSAPTTKTYCNYKPVAKENQRVEHDFTKGGGIDAQLLEVAFRQYDAAETAARQFAQIQSVLHRCHKENYEGSRLSYALMSAPKVGAGSFGVKLTADGTELMQMYVLVGPTIIAVNGGGLMTTDADVITAMTKKQVQRYTDAATK